MSDVLQKAFLALVRMGLGLGAGNLDVFKNHVNWVAIQALAEKQMLSAVVLDGIERLPAEMRPPKVDLLQWIGEVLQSESVYATQWKSACDLARVFEDNYIRTYILKGFVVSECYPQPEHRVSVDLDSFLIPHKGDYDAWELGNQLMENAGFEVDRSFYKNSTIILPGLMVENHQFMTAIRGSKRLKNFELMLQSYIHDDKGEDKFEGTSMYRPPLMVSALFLIEHAHAHFLHEGITWRHVLDWMMFSRKHKYQIDWYTLDAFIDEFGFRQFYTSYVRLGWYLLGEVSHEELTKLDLKMLADVWADLDLHEFHGIKGKIALAGNEIRAAWKYHYFSSDMMITDLLRRVTGFIFERHPKIERDQQRSGDGKMMYDGRSKMYDG